MKSLEVLQVQAEEGPSTCYIEARTLLLQEFLVSTQYIN